jgi:hypothetical protein
MKYESICFFLESGNTFTFRNCELITDNESIIVIDYVAASDGKNKRATFFKDSLAGVSFCAEP